MTRIVAIVSIIAACDPAPGACTEPGTLFGPCIDGTECAAPFTCHDVEVGTMCIPPTWWVDTRRQEVKDCALEHSGLLDCESVAGSCVVPCGLGCGDVTVCDDGPPVICVYPPA